MYHFCCDNSSSQHFWRSKQITNKPAKLNICNSICNAAYNPHPDFDLQLDKDHLCAFIWLLLSTVVCRFSSPYFNTTRLKPISFAYMIGVLVYKRFVNKLFPLKAHEEVTGKNFTITADSFSFKHKEKFAEFNLSTLGQLYIILHSSVTRSHSNVKYRQKFLHLITLS